ncbi:hypothetical protein BV20DRAFT_1050297 [Pilatotrama ljubarskyi]|nr:hypothetical protein BV20DRAFT_1050297 [Pilatotrama ljubarskyi]
MDSLQYPYHNAHIHFGAELSDNYLATQRDSSAVSVDHVVPSTSASLGTSVYDPSIPNAVSPFDGQTESPHDQYTRWYASGFEHSDLSAVYQCNVRSGLDEPIHHPHPVPLSAAEYSATHAKEFQTYAPTIYQSSYSSIADALIYPSSPESGASLSIPPPASLSPVNPAPTPTTIQDTSSVSGSELGSAPPASETSGRRSKRGTGGSTRSPYPKACASASSSRHSSPSELVHCPRRNAVVSPATSTSPLGWLPTNPWKCPYCSYVQRKKRSPDLKRHIATHTRPTNTDEALWVCCGVPLIDAQECRVPTAVLLEEPFLYEGLYMVGGCRKVFSRKDALRRHLRTHAGICFGDALAPYLPGNKVGAR